MKIVIILSLILLSSCDIKWGHLFQNEAPFSPRSIQQSKEYDLLYATYKYDSILSTYKLDSNLVFREIWLYHNAYKKFTRPFVKKGVMDVKILCVNVDLKPDRQKDFPWTIPSVIISTNYDSTSIYIKATDYRTTSKTRDTIYVDVFPSEKGSYTGIAKDKKKLGYFVFIKEN